MTRLKELRKAKGYTQVKIQMLTGIDQSDYSKIDSGKRYYTFEQCKRLAVALDTGMDYLAGLTDERSPYPRKSENEKRQLAASFFLTFFRGLDIIKSNPKGGNTMSEKVVLILADGLRPDAMMACGHPFAEKMKALSTYTLGAQTVVPSVTLPCHMSLFHSVDPARHGTTTNTYMPQVRPIDGMVEVLRRAKKKCAFFITWDQLRDLCRPGKLDVCDFMSCYNNKNVNELITPRAISYIKEQSPDFVFLYLADTDNTGHDHGWMSAEYMQDAHDAIECVKQVYESIPENYTVIFLADHGGHDRTHGTELPEDMTIPLFFMGPRFEKGRELPTASIKDVAPTVAALLGVDPAEEWEGKPVI